MANIQKRVRADGKPSWTMRVFIGRDDNGRRKFVTRTFEKLGDAKAEARRLERFKDRGELVSAPSKEPLSKYLTRWLDVKEGLIRARTIHDYRGIVRRYVQEPPKDAPPIGAIPLNRLTVDAFEELYVWLRSRGNAPRTIRYLHTVLRQALKEAVKKGALVQNPTDHATVPKEPKRADDAQGGEEGEEEGEGDMERKVPAMNEQQAKSFLKAARSDRYSALWHLLLTGGLRPSEALGLKWKDVNLEAGRVHVRRTLTRVGVKGWKLVPTKTKKSRRAVPLPPVATRTLREWKATQNRERLQLGAEWKDHGLVFTNEFGRPLDHGNLADRNFRRVCAGAGLGEWGPEPKPGARGPRGQKRFKPAFRMYDLRHTCATLLLEKGESIKVVSERLGHASIVLTADTYSHVLPTMQQAAADRLEGVFGGA